ncbi:hypothetical protein NKR23_g7668 [Pleurostoma richardsiae]|uniref:Uncharacterized protein n=1 Tax=Pleurostoma richardsiae TaxID=41990 RepID=A0AA38RB86_9PEZI|nr:hypothetical protein NKR23_g7668 [Pleurostoma richardsiae]
MERSDLPYTAVAFAFLVAAALASAWCAYQLRQRRLWMYAASAHSVLSLCLGTTFFALCWHGQRPETLLALALFCTVSTDSLYSLGMPTGHPILHGCQHAWFFALALELIWLSAMCVVPRRLVVGGLAVIYHMLWTSGYSSSVGRCITVALLLISLVPLLVVNKEPALFYAVVTITLSSCLVTLWALRSVRRRESDSCSIYLLGSAAVGKTVLFSQLSGSSYAEACSLPYHRTMRDKFRTRLEVDGIVCTVTFHDTGLIDTETVEQRETLVGRGDAFFLVYEPGSGMSFSFVKSIAALAKDKPVTLVKGRDRECYTCELTLGQGGRSLAKGSKWGFVELRSGLNCKGSETSRVTVSITVVTKYGERTRTYDQVALQRRRLARQELVAWRELSKTDVTLSIALQMAIYYLNPPCRCLGIEWKPLRYLPAWRERSKALIHKFPAEASVTLFIFRQVLSGVASALLRPLPSPTLVSVEINIATYRTGYDSYSQLSIHVRALYALRSLGICCIETAAAAQMLRQLA